MINYSPSPAYPEQKLATKAYKAFLLTDEMQTLESHSSYYSPTCSTFLVIFRVIVLSILAWRWTLQGYRSLFSIFQYLTSLGFNTTLIYFSMVSLDFVLNSKMQPKVSPTLSIWVNFMFQLSFCVGFPITGTYWMILFDYKASHTYWDIIKDIGVHGFPLICMLIDFAFNSFVFPLKHLGLIFVYAALYLAINLGYSLSTKLIYVALDWVSIRSYGLLFCGLLAIAVAHRVAYWIGQRWKPCKTEATRRIVNVSSSTEKTIITGIERVPETTHEHFHEHPGLN